MLAYVVAGVVAFGVASFAALQEHERHPFGDERLKAVFLWAALGLLDVVVAEAALTGAFTLVSAESLEHLSGVVRAAAIGFLAPLAVRSPVREVRIGDKKEQIGFTEIYDRARVRLNRELDERITRLRRQDKVRVAEASTKLGWDVVSFLGRVDAHIEDAGRFEPVDRERIRESLRSANTAKSKSERLRAMINVALSEHLTSVLGDCQKQRPTAEDLERGRRVLREWAALSKKAFGASPPTP